MKKFIPYEKLSKKKQRELNASGSVKYYAQICLQKLKNEASTSMTGGRQPSCQP